MSTKAPYYQFGALLTSQRVDAGLATQADLASRLKVAQQTVSRWEAGLSRPRAGQMAAVAAAVGANADRLMEAAGYQTPKAAIVSYDAPFPFEALSPETFERFTADLIQKLYPDSNVNRLGGQGHEQAGGDVVASFEDGRRFGFQCKRVAEFGPQKVRDAVAKYTGVADRKFLVLSRVASPDARDALAGQPGWALWDRDDLSRKIRELPLEEQKRIVRIYFPGQEQALLGTSATSPWETSNEFFAPFARHDALFNHEWALVGRDAEVQAALAALLDQRVGLTLLTGTGGSGKSRVLKEILRQLSLSARQVKVRIASPTMEITKASLDELGIGDLILVVDDAHDRDDLQVLFGFAAAGGPRVRLFLAARRYGVDHIKAQAGGYSISGEHLKHIDVPRLSQTEAEALAKQVLEQFEGPVAAAADIARLTIDCPLATVIGAQVVARDNVHPNFVQSEDRFRRTLLGKFEEAIAGHLSDRENPVLIQKLLGFLALVQPIGIDDDRTLTAFEMVEGISLADTKRILRLLLEAGILFKRGAKYRISPDVLGDYLIEARFEGVSGSSNGLAERFFDNLPAHSVENLVVNLGRVDWRRTGSTAEQSPLLDGIWRKLKPASDYDDAHIKAVRAVAYYQPSRALDFVEDLIRDGQFLDQLAGIAKYAAYTAEYTNRACEVLWELGRNDDRQRHSEPSHAIRILKELAEPQPSKPLYFNELIVDFACELSKQPSAWTGLNTPLDILDGIFSTEGHSSSYSRHAVSLTPFLIDPQKVQALRSKAIGQVIALLGQPGIRQAVRAAESVGTALRSPIGLMGASVTRDVYESWNEEFEKTLRRIVTEIDLKGLDPLVQVQLNRSVNWQVRHGRPDTAKLAKKIQAALASNLDTRLDKLLVDGYGSEDRSADHRDFPARWSNHVASVAEDLVKAYPVPAQLIAFIASRFNRLQEAAPGRSSTLEVIVGRLIESFPDVAEAVVKTAIDTPEHCLARFSGWALGQVFRQDAKTGRRWVGQFLKTDRNDLWTYAATCYQAQPSDGAWLTIDDRKYLTKIASGTKEPAILAVFQAASYLKESQPELVRSLVNAAAIPSANVADKIAVLFEYQSQTGLKFDDLSEAEVLSLLTRFEPLPELKGHWLDKLVARISERYPNDCAHFFMRRVDAASADSGLHIRPCNYGPWAHEPLRFRGTAANTDLMRTVVKWMRDGQDRKGMFGYHSRNLFQVMFAPFDAPVVELLRELIASATPADIKVVAQILREAGRDFIFKETAFVIGLMEQAQRFGPKLRDLVSSELYCSAIDGMKAGAAGQPFPEDVALKENSDRVLATLSRLSPAFELFDDLRQHAERQIQWKTQEDEDFDE